MKQPVLQAVTLGWNVQLLLLLIDQENLKNKKETSPPPAGFFRFPLLSLQKCDVYYNL